MRRPTPKRGARAKGVPLDEKNLKQFVDYFGEKYSLSIDKMNSLAGLSRRRLYHLLKSELSDHIREEEVNKLWNMAIKLENESS